MGITTRRRRGLVGMIGAVGGVALLVAGCGSSSSGTSSSTGTSSASSSTVTISTASVAGLGTVLVDAQGRTLYMFEPDEHAKVTCTGSCASVWPPAQLSGTQKPAAAGGAKSTLLGSDPNPSGGKVVTYAGWPLYTYVADSAPGTAHGQALKINGGLWYVMAASGAIVTKKP